MSRASLLEKDECDITETNPRSMDSIVWKFEARNVRIEKYQQKTNVETTNIQETQATTIAEPKLVKNKSFDRFHNFQASKNKKGTQRPISATRSSHRSELSSPLYSLSFVEKGLATLPNEILANKHQVNLLDLTLNKFDFFPLDIIFLKNLKILRLDHNRLKCLPNDLSHLYQLEILSLSYNLLQNLPSSLCKLTALTELNLEFNLMDSFGPELTELKGLRVLNINRNRLIHFPNSFCNMICVIEINFEWFKYTNPPLAGRQRGRDGELKIQRLREVCKVMHQKNQKGVNFSSFVDLMSTEKVNLQSLDETHKSFLHYSALYEDVSVMKYMISFMPSLLDMIDADGQTPLTLSIIKEKYLAARYLLKHGANPTKGGGVYGSPLHIAVRKLNFQLVKDIVKLGENLNKIDSEGHTPLHHSIALMADGNQKAIAISQFLLENGGNPNAKNKENWTPLHLAARKKDVKTIEWLLAYNKEVEEVHGREEKFNINKKGGSYKWTAMHIAAYSDASTLLETLAKAKCDIFKKSLNGYAPKRLVHHHGLSLKLIEKYEKSTLYNKIIYKQNLESEHLADLNLQNLNKTKEIFNASKNKFEHVLLYGEIADTGVFGNLLGAPATNPMQRADDLSYANKHLRKFVPFLANHKVMSKNHDDSFEITPETETHNSFGEENDTARLDFGSELNENVNIKANTFSRGLAFTEKNFAIKNVHHTRSPSKNKFSVNFIQFLNIDVTNYDNYLSHEPSFNFEFCKNEIKVLKENFFLERIIFTEKMKIFVLFRILHYRIVKHIAKCFKIDLPCECFPLLPMKDSLSTLVKNNKGLAFRKADLQVSSLMYELIPQALIGLYSLIPNGSYEMGFMKSTIISILEEFHYYKAGEFLESVMNDPTESVLAKQQAKRVTINLRNIYEGLTMEFKVSTSKENSHARGRTPSPSSTMHATPLELEKSSANRRRVYSGMQLNTKAVFTPIRIPEKTT